LTNQTAAPVAQELGRRFAQTRKSGHYSPSRRFGRLIDAKARASLIALQKRGQRKRSAFRQNTFIPPNSGEGKMSKRPRKLLDQACTERGTPARPEPVEGLSKYARSHPPETLLHSPRKGQQSVRTVRSPVPTATAGGVVHLPFCCWLRFSEAQIGPDEIRDVKPPNGQGWADGTLSVHQ